MQGTQYATKRSILCRGAFCGPTEPAHEMLLYRICVTSSLILIVHSHLDLILNLNKISTQNMCFISHFNHLPMDYCAV